MKISNKIHRGASVAAAVFLLIVLLLGAAANLITLINFSSAYSSIVSTVLTLTANTVTGLLMVAALFRGRKDALAGVFFLIAALSLFVTGGISNAVTFFSAISMGSILDGNNILGYTAAGSFLMILANLVSIVFRGLLAAECFKPGQLSGSSLKMLLPILPIVNILMVAVSNIVRQLFLLENYGLSVFLINVLPSFLLSAVMSAGNILMGLALAIPVYEKNSHTYDPLMEYNFN